MTLDWKFIFPIIELYRFIKWCQEFSVATNLQIWWIQYLSLFECIQKSNANKNESPHFLQLEQNWELVKTLLMTGLQVMKNMCCSFLHWELMETRPHNFASQNSNSFLRPCSHHSKIQKDDWCPFEKFHFLTRIDTNSGFGRDWDTLWKKSNNGTFRAVQVTQKISNSAHRVKKLSIWHFWPCTWNLTIFVVKYLHLKCYECAIRLFP